MKIVIGIDNGGRYKAALNLAARLNFDRPTWALAHSVDLNMVMSGYGTASDAAYGLEFVNAANEAGKEALDVARDDACAHGFNADTAMLVGNAASALVQYAEDVKADLVCVHSERKGRLGSLFLGSVSRGLAIGAKHSVLISKGQVGPKGPLNLVFATDHSEYANKALSKFIAMAPKGVKSIHVVNALHLDEKGGHFDTSKLDVTIEKYLAESAERKTEDAVAKLRNAGYSCSGTVANLPVNEAIGEAMKSTKADLLVMGAQGHGFMDRLLLGSTSLHQVVVEPWSVLVLRP